ncbi:POC1 centriolar -like protein A [Halotydeus destructor]|nr:POC1 centriolar -like protein A [Halotydeus destructor]
MMTTEPNYGGSEPELANTLRAHKTGVNSVAFSPDTRKLVSGSDDGSIVFWNLIGSKPQETGLCYRLIGHKGAVNSVDYASNGEFFVSSSVDTTVRLWKLNATQTKPNEEPIVYKCHSVNVRSVNLNSDATLFCTSSDDKTVKIWDAKYRNKFLTSLLGHTNWVRCAKFCPSKPDLVASCGDDCQILVHDVRSPVRSPPVYSVSGSKGKHHSYSHFTTLDWFPMSDFLMAVGSSDASLRIYDLRQRQIVQYYEAHNGPVSSIEFHKSGNYLISGSTDNLIKVYDLLEGRVLFTIRAHTGPVKCVRFSKQGESFASSGNDKTIYLWKSNFEMENGEEPPAINGNAVQTADSISPLKVHSQETIPKSAHHSSKSSLASQESAAIGGRRRRCASVSNLSDQLKTRSSSSLQEEQEEASSSQGLTARFKNKGHLTANEPYLNESPEQNLLQGIVSQIGNLTDAITLLEKRLTIVESIVEGINS